MKKIGETKAVAALLLFGLACLPGTFSRAAEDESNETLIEMVTELVSGADRDMRALGFQQVREEAPGEAATKKFAALLVKLPPDGQAGLLEALGDRGDTAARPAVLEMLKSPEEPVRAAALRALGALGTAAEVPTLAERAAGGSKLEKRAARASLVRLRGDDVNATIVAAMSKGDPNTRVELLGVLAARDAEETLPSVLASAKDAEPSVRLAAIGALRFLAGEDDTPAMVALLKAAGGDAERRQARLALLAVCSRGRQECSEAIIAGLADAVAASRIALLDGLARAGGPEALKTVVARLEDDDEAVRHQAVRLLSGWPEGDAASHLLAIAKKEGNLRHQVLAIRGLVRLASPLKDKPADLETLAAVLKLAKRPQEKRLVLGVLGGIGTPASLALVLPALDDPALAEEAGLAGVMIAEKMQGGNKDEVRTALEKVLKCTKSQKIRKRARQILKSP